MLHAVGDRATELFLNAMDATGGRVLSQDIFSVPPPELPKTE
jgi:hypothetical protein